MPSWLFRISGALAFAVLTLCLAATAVLGWEDRLALAGTREAIETAIRLAPGDARSYSALASLGGKDRGPALERAVTASPFDSKAWIALGLDAELEGNRTRAERCLLEAARVDKTYAPRWSLANFYFRTDDRERFWPWLREAARMSYGDPRPLAHLAWNLAGDAPEALAALGDRQPILESYVSLLLDNNRLGPAETAIGKLLASAGKDAAGAALVYCDRFLDAGRPEAALRLWNRLAAARWIPTPPLDPERGPHLTNGDFASDPLSRGFDWRPQGRRGREDRPAAGGQRLAAFVLRRPAGVLHAPAGAGRAGTGAALAPLIRVPQPGDGRGDGPALAHHRGGVAGARERNLEGSGVRVQHPAGRPRLAPGAGLPARTRNGAECGLLLGAPDQAGGAEAEGVRVCVHPNLRETPE